MIIPIMHQWYDTFTMTVDVRSLQANVLETFDFDSQGGILFLLRAIRVAPIDQIDKNTLKDLVFLCNTGTKDHSLRQKLEKSLADLGVTPAVVAADIANVEASLRATVTPAAGFSGGRLAPVFEAPAGLKKENIPTPAPKITTHTRAAQAALVPDVPATTESIVRVLKVAPTIVASTTPVVSVGTEPQIVKVAIPTPVQVSDTTPLNVIPVPTPKTTLFETEKLAPQVQTSNGAPSYTAETVSVESSAHARMERIRSIKSNVNDRIGNPVNLVDVDNAVGREYMSALLEAMKLLSSASEAESRKAMSRLEAVYAQVLLLLDTIKEQSQSIPDPTSIPIPTPAPVAAFVPSSTATPVTPISPVMPVVSMQTQTTTVERIVPVVTITPAVPVSPAASDFAVRSKIVEKQQAPEPVSGWAANETVDTVLPVSSVETLSSVANQVAPSDAVVVNRLSTPPAEPLRPVLETEVPSYQPEAVQSVTDQVQPLRNLHELKTADEVSAIEAIQNNPLYTKDVDLGLDQLLGEWSIFKKSGLFGTGPKGREHPLYVKINGMHLPLILAGRFEGSTQEIKQSITDYMNGWRYEQGIVYDQGETLDQYLRRVIRHIIDLQKSKRRS